MTKNFLTLMSGPRGHLFFGALYFLSKKMKMNNYFIIDRHPNSQSFFENQQFVSFEKTFFYRNHVKAFHKPDIDYLQKIEKKYNLNLWKIISGDPTFYDYSLGETFTSDEMLSLIEDDCKLYETVLEKSKPDYLIIHTGGQKHLNLLESMAIANNVKILKFAAARFGKRFQISKKFNLLDELKMQVDDEKSTLIDDDYLDSIQKELDLYNFYRSSSPWGYRKGFSEFIIGSMKNLRLLNPSVSNDYVFFKNRNYIQRNFRLFKNKVRKKIRENFLDKNSLKVLPNNEKFVFYPLQLQPEYTTAVLTPHYSNQIALIKNIARSIPIDYTLYVKEHFTQGRFANWRDIEFYKSLLEIPNVKLIHPSINIKSILEKCSLVLTINGSVSYEAIFFNKPVIVFSDTSSMVLPYVRKIDDIEDLPSAIRESLQLSLDTSKTKNYIDSKLSASFEIDHSLFRDSIEKFYLNYVQVDNISNHNMELFLNGNKEQLKIVSDKFFEKIQQYENDEIIN